MLNVLYVLCKLKKCLWLGVKMEVMCFVFSYGNILYFGVFLNCASKFNYSGGWRMEVWTFFIIIRHHRLTGK